MNLILSVYSKDAFREYQLPSFNNADYTITLRSDFFHFSQNRSLYLEVLEHQWSFKQSAFYRIQKNGDRYERHTLKDQDVLNLQIHGEKEMVIIVKYVDSVFHAYEKYVLSNVNQITIGEKADNDISYDYRKLVSREHAVMVRAGAGFKIVNNSLNGTFVNSHRVEKEQVLNPGACIDIMGLRMIYLGNCLAVDVAGSGAKVNTRKLISMPPVQIDTIHRGTEVVSHGKSVYHRSPRTFHELAGGAIEIEMPPQMNPQKQQPLLLTTGPSLTMAVPMVAGCLLMTANSSGGSPLSMYSGLIMSVSSAVFGVFWALQNIRFQNRAAAEAKRFRFERYSEYLLEKTQEIKESYENAVKRLLDLYPDAGRCLSYDGSKGILWNRNATHKDYLKHRLGIGNMPFPIAIQAQKKKFSLYKDELADKPYLMKENYDVLYDVPVVLDLSKHKLIGSTLGNSIENKQERVDFQK